MAVAPQFKTDEEFAKELERIVPRDELGGEDGRSILVGLTPEERDRIVRALRRSPE